MANSTEAVVLDLKDVELNEMDPEKQPMAPAGETNGALKVKVLEDEADTKFTGLSKEELLKVAGTPAWVRTRWALLILFWAGWLGMLAGAVVIIVQAPRCRDLPPQEWWQKGALYQIGAVEAFQDSDGDGNGDLAGIKQRMDELGALKVKGLVIGPIHSSVADRPDATQLTEIDRLYGTMDNFTQLLETARKKSIMVVLDLTPNYKGEHPWFSNNTILDPNFQRIVKEAMDFWLEKGVAGIRLGGVDQLKELGLLDLLEEWNNVTANHTTEGKSRVLIAVTDGTSEPDILAQLNQTSSEFLSSQYLLGMPARPRASDLASKIQNYLEAAGQRWTSWSVGGPQVGHMASLVHQDLLRLYNILLFTLPGTPFTNYGDEIGLQDQPGQPAKSIMHWDSTDTFGFSRKVLPIQEVNRNISVEAQKDDKTSLLRLYKRLSELRGKERSLLHGDFFPLERLLATEVYAYLRVWDQNDRFLVALNLAETPATVALEHEHLPTGATLVLSSDPQRQEGSVELNKLVLAPSEGVLLKFPYTA
ncbi:amino acid transporter heavy chain SLC3A2 [Ambystoma mexicanum]|uniref:amino acid transporter heavy chain SLC3A2 n=1 Tax=Ambystoma mexicanum TaxID=8296 RepID=UPI0037E769EC